MNNLASGKPVIVAICAPSMVEDHDPVAAAVAGLVGQVGGQGRVAVGAVTTRRMRSSRPPAGTVAKNSATASRPTNRIACGGMVSMASSRSSAASAGMSQACQARTNASTTRRSWSPSGAWPRRSARWRRRGWRGPVAARC